LTQEPFACVTAEPADRERIAEGEALFNSPFLLGGQAAKAGLSCAACHRNGRGNPDFAFGALSENAGHADVTDAFLGPKRADGIDNPVAIPDLADAASQTVSRKVESLTVFLDAQLTEEFEAARAAPETLAALAAYVAAIGAPDCPGGLQPMSYRSELMRAQTAIERSAVYARTSPKAEAALRLAARAALGRLHERYPMRRQAELRASLTDISRRIGAGEAPASLLVDLQAVAIILADEAEHSLYDAGTVRRLGL
jgi:hypothetical protein